MDNFENVREAFINFIDEINHDYFLNIEIIDGLERTWGDEDEDFWEFTTTDIGQARIVYLDALLQRLQHHQLYDRNLVLFIENMIPPHEVFDEVYERFMELPDSHPDVELKPMGYLVWGFYK